MKKIFCTALVFVCTAFLTGCSLFGDLSGLIPMNESFEEIIQEIQIPDSDDFGSLFSTLVPGNADSSRKFNVREYILREDGYAEAYYVLENLTTDILNVRIKGNAIGRNGSLLETDTSSSYVIGPHKKFVLGLAFLTDDYIDHIDVQIDSTEDIRESAVEELSVREDRNPRNIVLTLENKGTEAAESVQVCALFFDRNKELVSGGIVQAGDVTGAVPVGKQDWVQISSDVEYETVEYYIFALKPDQTASESKPDRLSPEQAFTIEEKELSPDFEDQGLALLITNKTGKTVNIQGVAITVADVDRRTGADRFQMDTLGPGETRAGVFWFPNIGKDSHVQYSLSYEEDLKHESLAGELHVSESGRDSVSVTGYLENQGSASAEFWGMTVLFYDEEGRILDFGWFSDIDKPVLRPGEKTVFMATSELPFENVEFYPEGSKKKSSAASQSDELSETNTEPESIACGNGEERRMWSDRAAGRIDRMWAVLVDDYGSAAYLFFLDSSGENGGFLKMGEDMKMQLGTLESMEGERSFAYEDYTFNMQKYRLTDEFGASSVIYFSEISDELCVLELESEEGQGQILLRYREEEDPDEELKGSIKSLINDYYGVYDPNGEKGYS